MKRKVQDELPSCLKFLFFRPEADPAVLLAWIENENDLANIHRAARVKRKKGLKLLPKIDF